jgi:hypothetical protein
MRDFFTQRASRSIGASASLFIALLAPTSLWSATNKPANVTLDDSVVRLNWIEQSDGWHLSHVAVRTPSGEISAGLPAGRYTLLYSATAPKKTPTPFYLPGHEEPFPGEFTYATKKWEAATSPVSLNVAGEERAFFPTKVERTANGAWVFTQETDVATLSAIWRLDPSVPGDLEVAMTLTAKRVGWFSIATPTLSELTPAELKWAVVPGYFQGAELNPNLPLALGYGHGLPDRPVLARERGASTLASIMTNRAGVTLAVAAEPGTATDPWPKDKAMRDPWRLGLSHMNRQNRLAPTLYHPVLGEDDSRLAPGDQRTFRFRYVLRHADWFAALKHVINDVYRLPDFLALKQPARSLSDRLAAMQRYLTDDQTSLWRTVEFEELKIGAQDYLGGILGSDKDGMKNSDYGAMWMLAKLTNDPELVNNRLPFARNFKLAQQQADPGFFQGAPRGQYFLWKSRRFTDEWGQIVEPVAVTYYTMLDLGNILLFAPDDRELRERLKLGAERLLEWQNADGSWEVAYDHTTKQPLYRETPDLRPTFYGLLVAYRILGDERYLEAARRGADWVVKNAVEKGRFLGVCGDTRFAPDFATAQLAQALLDLHALTGEESYRSAAIITAQFYVTSIVTHPLPTTAEKFVNGQRRTDWEITQAGLGFEHGGVIGSTWRRGPILLATHAGLFVRMHALTGETLFRDLARAAALARDAFVNPETSVASYYWSNMDAGAGRFPHHAWWQIGWITDYLISEATLRSAGQISFPAGFITPKVGPHRSYGFAPGSVLGEEAELAWGGVETDHPAVDTLVARATETRRVFVILLNQRAQPTSVRVKADIRPITRGAGDRWKSVRLHSNASTAPAKFTVENQLVELPAFGWSVLAYDY